MNYSSDRFYHISRNPEIVSLIIILVILFAAYLILTENNSTPSEAARELTKSGTTGECQWELYGTDLYIIGDNGGMEDYDKVDPPWGEITSVTFCNVTSIGSNSFCGQSKLTSVTIPDCVIEIHQGAFKDCSNLLELHIGKDSKLNSIGDYSFYDCKSLGNVYFPEKLRDIQGHAFENCSSMTSVDLRNPSSIVLRIYAFKNDRSLETVFFGKDIEFETGLIRDYPQFENCDGIQYFYTERWSIDSLDDNVFVNCGFRLKNDDGTNMLGTRSGAYVRIGDLMVHAARYGNTGEDVWAYNTINNTLSIIGKGKMGDYNEGNPAPWAGTMSNSHVSIHSGITGIGDYAFFRQGISSVDIPESVCRIGDYSFAYDNELKEITIKGPLGYLGKHAFDECISLERISFESTLENIEEGTFMDCINLKSIRIPSEIKTIGSQAFHGCIDLSVLDFPRDELTSIGEYAFHGCCSLDDIELPPCLKTLGAYAFGMCTDATSLRIYGGSLSEIGDHAFYMCISLKSVDLPVSIKVIGPYSFAKCNSMYHMYIPDGVTKIGNYAFYGCCSLWNVITPVSLCSIGDYAFYGCSINSVHLGTMLREVGCGAFGKCTCLTEAEFSAYTVDLEKNAFEGCSSLEKVNYTGANLRIHEYCFCGCCSLKGLSLGHGWISVEGYSFENCTSLEKLDIYGSSDCRLAPLSFDGCNSLSSVIFERSKITLSDHVFNGCSSLETISLLYSKFTMDRSTFYDCGYLRSISITESNGCILSSEFDRIANQALSSQNFGLERLSISDSAVEIGRNAFCGCVSLSELTMDGGSISIDDYAFNGCDSLKYLSLPESVRHIGMYAFAGCTGIEDLVIYCPASSMDRAMFSACTGVKSLYLANEVWDWVNKIGGISKTMLLDEGDAISTYAPLPAGYYTDNGANCLIHQPSTIRGEDEDSTIQLLWMQDTYWYADLIAGADETLGNTLHHGTDGIGVWHSLKKSGEVRPHAI